MNSRSTPLLGYLQSAVADNTAHSSIDKLMFENELSKQPQHSMSVQDEPLEMRPEDALPIGAGVKLFSGVPKWFRGQMVKGGKHMSPTQKRGWSPWDVKEGVWASTSKQYAEDMAETAGKKGMVLEFDVPNKWWEKASLPFRKDTIRRMQGKTTAPPNFYRGGIPKEYLKKVHKGYQQGGSAEKSPLLGYMNPAIQDETAHSQMDRLMFENELNQQPQHSIRTSPESLPFKMTPEDAVPIGTGIGLASKMIRGTDRFNEMLKRLSRISGQEKKKFEVLENARRKFGDKLDAGGADKAGKKYLTTLYLEKLLGK